MKKLIVAASALLLCFGAFAQSSQPLPGSTEDSVNKVLAVEDPDARKTQVFDLGNVYPELHPTASNASVEIDYVPLTDEVRIYYTCMAVSFKEGEAMNTVKACLEDFQKENNYYGYKYQTRDRQRYFKDGRGVKMATYSSFVKFNR